jgi:chromate transport protein ChrA
MPRFDRTNLLRTLALAFGVLTILSFYFSSTKTVGAMEVVRDAALVLIFVGTLGLSTRKKDHLQKWTMYILTCAAVIICVIGIPVFILQPFDRFVGAFFDPRYATDYFPNACAGFLLLAWPIALITIKNNRWKMFVMGLLIACLPAKKRN